MSSGSKDPDPIKIGYEYKLGIVYEFCQSGISNLWEIKLDKQKLWSGNETSTTALTINKKNFFGGEPPEGSGGAVGTIRALFGDASQAVDNYILNKLRGGNARTPAYRNRFCLAFKSFNWGTSGSAANPSVLLSGDGDLSWYNSKKWVTVTGADYREMNPIHMIYYWLTNNRNGLGLSPSRIDDTGFRAAADTCDSEGLGLSFFFGGENTVEDNIKEIANHADCTVYEDPSDGLWKVKLIRDDYTVGDLLTLNDSNSQTLEIFDTGIDEIVNQLSIEFYNVNKNTTSSITLHDLALRDAMGGYTVSKTIRYNGCNSRALARKLGHRDLKALTRPLKRVKVAANRSFSSLAPGDAVKWTNTDEGVTDLVMRVGKVSRGGLKNREIILDLTQDVYAYGTEVYDSDNPEEWVDPVDTAPADLTNVKLFEAPYWYFFFKFNGLPTGAEDGDGAVLINAARESNVEEYYRILEKLSTESTYSTFFEVGDFCPYGYLDSSGVTYDQISSGAITLTLQETSLLDTVRVGSVAMIDDEIYRVDAVDSDNDQVTLSVGCVDTVTKEHAANSIVWFWGYQGGFVSDDYLGGNTVQLKLLPKTPYDQLDESSATVRSITLDQRADKPYPPGKFRLNTAFYPVAIMDTLTISWAHRDRLTQANELHDEADGDIGPETNTNYEIRGYNENGTLVWSPDTPATSISWDYEDADSGLPNNRFNNQIRIRLWSTRDGLISFQEHDFTFDRADYGYSYGKYYGGYQ